MQTGNTTLRINADRAGTVKELTDYLNDLEAAYNSLYVFNNFLDTLNPNSRRRIRFFIYEFGLPTSNFKLDSSADFILPENRLVVSKINIQSPGFWEVIGSLNPLQQLREYLKDRHERRKDIYWREQSEKDKATFENQLIQRQVIEAENQTIRERIEILRELGFTNEEIRELIWTNVGKPLMELGKHQDTGLIKDAE
jgi:hypothetical protein